MDRSRRRAGLSPLVVVDVILLLLVFGVVLLTQTAASLSAVEPAVNFQRRFWDSRAKELCAGSPPAPALPAAPAGDPISQLGVLARIAPLIEATWTSYANCLEPATVTISEDLLHFKFNRFDEFEDPPDAAYRLILDQVQRNLTTHSEVYIFGHTDVQGPEANNNRLSYQRARHVADVIEQDLVKRGLGRQRGYNLYPVGRGISAVLPRLAGEDDEDWYKRCRRIEISFRSPVKERS
jgi:outer membrane protein OmpA-like peptidoglycan-associated protein